jgi:restriction endonuclease S subunit
MKKRLEQIVEIRSGATLRGRDATRPVSNGRYRLIRISDLTTEGEWLSDQFLTIDPPEEIREDFVLRPGDVLFASRGVRMQAAAFMDAHIKNAITGAQFFLLRHFKVDLLPEYLAWALNSPDAQSYFQKNTSGSYVPLVTIDILKKLEINVPPLEIQHGIVEAHRLGIQEKHILSRLSEIRQTLLSHQLQLASHKSHL